MAVISELIRSESDGTLSFGDYTLDQKSKLSGFEFQGDSYKVKTFKEITKLEKNESFVENEYEVLIDDFHIGGMKTNLGGKLVLGIEFNGRPHKVVVKKR